VKAGAPYGDSVSLTQLGTKRLTPDWQFFECRLAAPCDFRRLVGGFGWTATWSGIGIEAPRQDKKFTFEVRNIRYEMAAEGAGKRRDVFHVYMGSRGLVG